MKKSNKILLFAAALGLSLAFAPVDSYSNESKNIDAGNKSYALFMTSTDLWATPGSDYTPKSGGIDHFAFESGVSTSLVPDGTPKASDEANRAYAMFMTGTGLWCAPSAGNC